MMKPAIVIDSTFYVDYELIKKYDIHHVSLTVNFDNVSYKESFNDPNVLVEVFDKIESVKKLPKTSQPAAMDFLNKFKELHEKGYKKIIVLTIANVLSGTIQGAKTAAQMFCEEHSDIEINCYDSKNVAQGAGICLVEICKYIEEKGDITEERLVDMLEFYSKHTKIFLIVDNLNYLSYGGRIPSSLAAIGNIFSIKPLLVIEQGEIKEYAKARTIKKAYKLALDVFEKEYKNNEQDIFITAAHAMNEKDANKLVNSAITMTNGNVTRCPIIEFGPVVGMHVGPNAVGIGWSIKYDNNI